MLPFPFPLFIPGLSPTSPPASSSPPADSPQPTPLPSSNTTPATPTLLADYDYRRHIVWTDVSTSPWIGDDGGSAFHRDVMTHSHRRYGSKNGLTTQAHETVHMLVTDVSNATPERDNFVYYGAGRGVTILEPKMNARQIRNYVPEGAKTIAQSRYKTYIIEQVDEYWPQVLYQFDEWGAYVVGAHVGVELVRAGRWDRTVYEDVVDGMMDFLYFGSAAALALKQIEPVYFNSNAQFKAAFAMLAEETAQWLNEGLALDNFGRFHARQLRDHFVKSPENVAIREMLKDWYGAGWTMRVLGF